MSRLIIRHETRYTYERPVAFGPHRLLIRPRDSHAMRVVDASLSFSPQGQTRWAYDALGNSVCWLAPEGQSQHLIITNALTIERFPAPLVSIPVRDPQTALPIVYEPVDRAVLAPFMEPATEDANGLLLKWLRGQLGAPDETALNFLLRLNHAIHDQFVYNARFEPGTQEPDHTVATGAGTCRDFAWLMVEGLRRMGYAARFVTGYLYSPSLNAVRGAGATHAWCEVFLPDLGWIELDPTNGLAESADLIPVAMTRTPAEAIPVSGAIVGDGGYSELTVHVDVQLAGSHLEAA
jgi:YD repeat-containing protein